MSNDEIYARVCALCTRWLPGVSFGPKEPSLWEGEEPLHPDLVELYGSFGPEDADLEGVGNATLLVPLDQLHDLLYDYAVDGTGEPVEDWEPAWIVVASEGGDPYIFHRGTGRCSFALHGCGAWEPVELDCSLAELVYLLVLRGAAWAHYQRQPDFDPEADPGDWEVPMMARVVAGGAELLGGPGRVVDLLSRIANPNHPPPAWYREQLARALVMAGGLAGRVPS